MQVSMISSVKYQGPNMNLLSQQRLINAMMNRTAEITINAGKKRNFDEFE